MKKIYLKNIDLFTFKKYTSFANIIIFLKIIIFLDKKIFKCAQKTHFEGAEELLKIKILHKNINSTSFLPFLTLNENDKVFF